MDAGCAFRVRLAEGFESFAETSSVFVGDGEDADAALGAAGFADEVLAAALVGVGYGGVYDLDEGLRHGVGDGARWLCAGRRSSWCRRRSPLL